MGNLISQAATGIGDILGNLFAAPFKSVFGVSCREACEGPWDLVCFIEHLCVAELVKSALITGLCYIILLFFYLLFKLGICQCIGKSLCKMCWTGCITYWCALGDICRFLWDKLMNTKWVYRGRRYRCQRHRHIQDLEAGSSVDEENSSSRGRQCHLSSSKKREQLVYPLSVSRSHSKHHHRHRLVKSKGGKMTFRVQGSSRRLRSGRHRHRISGTRRLKREDSSFKRPRLR